jgi:hypothetical protein
MERLRPRAVACAPELIFRSGVQSACTSRSHKSAPCRAGLARGRAVRLQAWADWRFGLEVKLDGQEYLIAHDDEILAFPG